MNNRERSLESKEELDPKFEATVKRMLETPPKPHKPIKDKKINVSSKGESD